ncbi:MAG: acyltransferase [Candidatus Diapherotrites archaeon]
MIEPLLECLPPSIRLPLERMIHKYDIDSSAKFGRNVKIIYNDKRRKGKFHVGKNSYIGLECIIDITTDVFIGDDVQFAPAIKVFTHDSSVHPAREKPVRIEDGVYIGTGVIVLPGVTIGKKAVIGAGAVVVKDCEGGKAYAGVPAKIIEK